MAVTPGTAWTVRRRRKATAREMAARLGVSDRTIRRLVAESRDDYISRAEQRRLAAVELREAGESWAMVAEKLGTSVDGAKALGQRAKKRAGGG